MQPGSAWPRDAGRRRTGTKVVLRQLDAAWREAEEIAAIADNLLLPPSVEEWIERQRVRLRSRGASPVG